MEGTNITDTAGAYASSASKSAAVNQAGYYDRPSTVFAKYQRVLCNKCHIKD
jgi:hypothetical protein